MPATRRWFRAGGTYFRRAVATTPSCCPSRASIFSGRYAHNHEVLSGKPGYAERLNQSATVQHYLRDAGYRTAIYGKYLNNWDLGRDPPHFDDWAIFANSSDHGYYDGTWNVRVGRGLLDVLHRAQRGGIH
jgi:arylsulfatase A-like enzyme